MAKEKTEALDEKAVAVIEKQVAPLEKRALSLVITTQEEQNNAGALLTEINRYNDELEKVKKGATDPINKTLKIIRSWFKPGEERREAAIQAIRTEMGRFQLEADKKAREEDAKIAARVAKGQLKPETGVRKMDEVERAEARIDTENEGVVKFRTDYDLVIDSPQNVILWSVENDEFGILTIDETAVKKLLKNGAKVDGAHLVEKRVVANSR